MLMHIIRNSEFKDIAKLATPAFFRVVPATGLTTQVRELMANRSDEADAEYRAGLRERLPPLGVQLVERSSGSRLDAETASERQGTGEAVLRLYFHQIMREDASLIDLRPESLHEADSGLEWSPKRAFVRWQDDFLTPLRDMYRGFYDDEPDTFRSALAQLNLTEAESAFRQHFGEGDQSAVAFSTRHFMNTFGEVFEISARAKQRLHRNFLPLGFYLAGLYQTLEGLGGTFDVRGAFRSV